MNIRFGGITEFQGPTERVKAHMDQLQEKNVETLTAHSDFNGSRAVALDGADTARFMKETYDFELPAEFKGKSKEEAGLMIMSNQEKYAPLLEKLGEMASDIFGFLDNVFKYVDARKAEGKDAEGNPIKQETIE